jgi:C-terminal processing protease CtpA/Prc
MRFAIVLLAVILVVPALATGPRVRAQDTRDGVTTLTGTVTVTNPFILSTYTERYMALIDLTAFVKRAIDRPLPSPTQVTTGLEGDWAKGATFSLPLPILPQGQINDVAHGQGGKGVQVYSLDLQANTIGDPYLSAEEFTGWSTALTSLDATIDTGEIVGGRVVVWAPDDKEQFPTGFGTDGKLFTADDPVDPIPAGWTVVDLDGKRFTQIRDSSVQVPILEGDAGLKDLSNLSYTAAFDELIKELRLRYPFTAYKHIDWDQIVSDIRPRIAQAERQRDKAAFNLAMLDFTNMLHDGHVAVSPPNQWIAANYGGGLGMYLGITDDRRISLRCVAPGLPAAKAGIEEAAVITAWNGEDPLAVLARTPEIFPASTDFNRELDRLTWMGRMKPGDKVTVTYENPGDTETKTATLVAVRDAAGLGSAPCGEQLSDPAEMPVTVTVLPSGIGYVKVDTFEDDVILMTHAWDWAIQRLNALRVPAVIVDVRLNSGGNGDLATYFAGSFYDKPFVLNTAFLSDDTGKQIDVGDTTVDPSPEQWKGPVAVIINPGCASACEIFAAAVAHDPNHLIVGRSPSAGVEAGVEPWTLPDGLYFQAPVIAFHNPDGSIFLEGVGVVPNVKVPNTPENLLVTPRVDAALDTAVGALQKGTPESAATPAA